MSLLSSATEEERRTPHGQVIFPGDLDVCLWRCFLLCFLWRGPWVTVVPLMPGCMGGTWAVRMRWWVRKPAPQSIASAGHGHMQPSCKALRSARQAKFNHSMWEKDRAETLACVAGLFSRHSCPLLKEKPCRYNFQWTWHSEWLGAWQVPRDVSVSDHAASPHPNVMYNTADLPSQPASKHNSGLVQRCLAARKGVGSCRELLNLLTNARSHFCHSCLNNTFAN